MFLKLFLVLPVFYFVSGNEMFFNRTYDDEKFNIIRKIVENTENRKSWITFLILGDWPDLFYKTMQGLPFTFVVINDNYKGYVIDKRYCAFTMVIDCKDYKDFENKINHARHTPYWHPHTNAIVYYHNYTESMDIIARIFFALWYYKVPNAILLQYKDAKENMVVTHFNPFISGDYKLANSYGCWTRKKLAYPFKYLDEGIVCTKECHNVSLHSKLRAHSLGTCIGFENVTIPYNDYTEIQKNIFFYEKAKNLHGFTLRAYTSEVVPFFMIDDLGNGSYRLRERDGFIWNSMAEAMNFTIDLSPSVKTMKDTFDFELNIQQIFDFVRRKADLTLLPIYLFDLVIIELDMTVPFRDSGLCFMSRKADYETTLFDVNLFQNNFGMLIICLFGFFGIWFVFFIFNVIEKNVISCDQAGKDWINAIRTMISVSLYKPPKKESFKIFLLVAIWSFFIINFTAQAEITSFFSAFKRGKEVDTFDDVIEKGYLIEAMASPDVMLPDANEKFRIINSRLVAIKDLYGCVKNITNDYRRFCLIDCAVGRYVARNKLNEKGEQYLHIGIDKVHDHYLTMMLQKDSALTDEYKRNMLLFLQAGLINKWEQYRFADIKYDAPIKSLDMGDLGGIFKCYLLLMGLSLATFIVEIAVGPKKEIFSSVIQK